MSSDLGVQSSLVLQGMFLLKALYWGQKGARDNYSLQIQNIIDAGHKVLGEMPTLIGECGIPMDMKYVFFGRACLLNSLLLATRRHLRRKVGHSNTG